MLLHSRRRKSTPAHAFASEVEDVIAEVEDKIGSDVPQEQKRFFAIKLLERDDKISRTQLSLMPDVSAEIRELEDHFDDDTESQSLPMKDMYTFLPSLESVLQEAKKGEKLTTSDKIDRFVTNRFLALPIFAVGYVHRILCIRITTVGGFLDNDLDK